MFCCLYISLYSCKYGHSTSQAMVYNLNSGQLQIFCKIVIFTTTTTDATVILSLLPVVTVVAVIIMYDT